MDGAALAQRPLLLSLAGRRECAQVRGVQEQTLFPGEPRAAPVLCSAPQQTLSITLAAHAPPASKRRRLCGCRSCRCGDAVSFSALVRGGDPSGVGLLLDMLPAGETCTLLMTHAALEGA